MKWILFIANLQDKADIFSHKACYQGRLRAPLLSMRIYVCTQAHYSGTLKGTLI